MGKIKNLIGDVLGYERCPVTEDTFYQADLVYVPCNARGDSIPVSARAVDTAVAYNAKKEIAKAILEQGDRVLLAIFTAPEEGIDGIIKNAPPLYSIDEIAAQIPDNCTRRPWKD